MTIRYSLRFLALLALTASVSELGCKRKTEQATKTALAPADALEERRTWAERAAALARNSPDQCSPRRRTL